MNFLDYGYVYIFRCGDQYKIGYSTNPWKRRRQLRTGSPHLVECIHLLRTPYFMQIEKQLHRRFAAKRGRGEWFSLDPDDIAYIKSLNKNGWTPERQAACDREWEERQSTSPNKARHAEIEAALQRIEKVFVTNRTRG